MRIGRRMKELLGLPEATKMTYVAFADKMSGSRGGSKDRYVV